MIYIQEEVTVVGGLGNKEIISKNIKYYMGLKGKERKEMCEDLGFPYTTFVDWINGVTYPRIDKIEMMANYFGIEKSDLIEERKNKVPSLEADWPEVANVLMREGKIPTPEKRKQIAKIIRAALSEENEE